MAEIIKIRRGLDIKLLGRAENILNKPSTSGLFAVKPTDFTGLIPKLIVKPGDPVKVGSPLFSDKSHPEIVFVSPVSGKVSDIRRGEKRKILAVEMESDTQDEAIQFPQVNISTLTREKAKEMLLAGGLWPFIRQRPYNVLANPGSSPKSIFISFFDSSPLAPDLGFILRDSIIELQAGIDILKKLTDGPVHASLKKGDETFSSLKGVQFHYFDGPHPSGNPGIQIHHIDPVNKGDIIWVVKPQDVLTIGRFFLEGKLDCTVIVALTGSQVLNPAYYILKRGASVSGMVKENIKPGESRYISGNVLTGTTIHKEDYLGFYDNQVTVIAEGKYFDFLGWALPGFHKFSTSRSYFSWLRPSRTYSLDTNLKGGHRAFVMTGEYEKVLPMDIYPVQLLKAILAENIDKMEQLGIYEVVEEDLALCEFVCTSKTDVQAILRKGLDMMKKEME